MQSDGSASEWLCTKSASPPASRIHDPPPNGTHGTVGDLFVDESARRASVSSLDEHGTLKKTPARMPQTIELCSTERHADA
eukprot:6784290-Prymnesium_polylepis.1